MRPGAPKSAHSQTNGLLLETGKPMDELVQKDVLDPLGMKDTTPPQNAALCEPVRHAYTGERSVWEESTF
jgi:CubicO group peptidase (beta-lactamase class C family)